MAWTVLQPGREAAGRMAAGCPDYTGRKLRGAPAAAGNDHGCGGTAPAGGTRGAGEDETSGTVLKFTGFVLIAGIVRLMVAAIRDSMRW